MVIGIHDLCFLVMDILSLEVSRRAVSGTRAGGVVIGEYQDGGFGWR